MERHADAVVIGGGPAGYRSAIGMARMGFKPILIERSDLGGTCTNRGCIPTKALIHAAKVLRDAKQGGRMGILADGISLDFSQLQKWNHFVVEKSRRGVSHLLESHGIEVLKGDATFLGPRRLLLNPPGDVINTERVLVATGSRPSDVPSIRFDSNRILSSDEVFQIMKLPRELAIIGGGVIGIEMATAFAYLGSKVKIIELMEQILPGFETALVRPVHDALSKAGVEINLKSSVVQSEYTGGGELRLTLADGRIIEPDIALVAIGRRPNTDSLGLDNAGVEVNDKGFIIVNDFLETSSKGIYAAGDVTGLPYLAHRAMGQGECAAENACGGRERVCSAIPSVVYSDPEIAVVGMDEQACSARALDFVSGVYSFGSSGRAQTLGRMEGFVKVLGESVGHKLLGVRMVGSSVSELIGGCSTMINASLTLEDLASGSYPHPTLSEAIMEAAKAALCEK
jgi:dihydrolipoamide dehydrogenase